MALPEERKESLKKLFCQTVDSDVLNEVEAMSVVQICIEACEREKNSVLEEMLRERIEDGTDSGTQ